MVQGDAICFSDNWRFKLGVHIFFLELKRSRNHKALLSAKFNQVRLDGEPHKSPALVFAAAFINARDEFTKGEGLLPAIDSHGLNCKPGNGADAMGCLPHARF